MRKLVAPLCLLATAGVGATALAGCSAGEATGLDPAKAAAATAKKGTARVTISTSVEGAGLPLPLSFKARGVSSLDSPAGRFTFDFGPLLALAGAPSSGSGALELIVRGGNVYAKPPKLPQLRVPGGKPWVSLELPKLAEALDLPTAGLGKLFTLTPAAQLRAFQAAKGLKKVGTEKVGGAQTTHYRGSYSVADLIASLPPQDRTSVQQALNKLEALGGPGAKGSFAKPVPAELWIDEDGVARRVLTETKLPAQGGIPGGIVKQSYELSDFGTPLDTDPPAAAQTYAATPQLIKLLSQLSRSDALGGATRTP